MFYLSTDMVNAAYLAPFTHIVRMNKSRTFNLRKETNLLITIPKLSLISKQEENFTMIILL
jgi:hypothetical protein